MLPEAHAASWREAGVPHRRLVDGGGHGPQVALAGHQLAEGVADVDDVDRLGADAGVVERALRGLPHQGVDLEALPGHAAGEVGLGRRPGSTRRRPSRSG